MSQKLHIDEAGFTGSDLNSIEQPYYVLASVLFSDEELERLKAETNIAQHGKELHFVKLKDSQEGRSLIDKILSHPLLDEHHIYYVYAYKRYCIYAQIINTLVETYTYYELGEDLYQNHQALVMANCLYSFCVNHKNQELITKFERNFVNMVRSVSNDTFTDNVKFFYDSCKLLYLNNGSNRHFS